MKEFCKTVATIVASVIGAGFISGRELVVFFGNGAYLPFLVLFFLLFSAYVWLLLSCGNRCGGFENFFSFSFPRAPWLKNCLFFPCLFIVVVAMFSALNSLEKSFAPFLAVLTAVACFFICEKGIGFLGKVNLAIVPLIALYLVVGLWGQPFAWEETPTVSVWQVCLYACMNVFLSAPVLMDCGGKMKGRWECAAAAAVSGALLCLLAGLILGTVGANALAGSKALPVYFVISFGKIYPLVAYLGIVTTLLSAYFPIHQRLKKQVKNYAARGSVLLAACLLAMFGFKTIVRYCYPVTGVVGVVFLAVTGFEEYFFRQRHQKIHSACQQAK